MHVVGLLRHVPLGVKVAMIMFPSWHVIVQFEGRDLYHTVTMQGVQTRGLCIEYDLAHCLGLLAAPAFDIAQDGSQGIPRNPAAQARRHDIVGALAFLGVRHLLA